MRGTILMLASVLVFASISLANDSLLPPRTVGPESVWSTATDAKLGHPRTTWSDSMQLLTEIYASATGAVAFGDTDHDNFNEVILSVNLGDFSYRILEEQGNNTYTEVFVGPYTNPYAAGDFDKDGRSEVLGQSGNRLVVYESPSPSTHPSVVSWQSPPLTNIIGYPIVADSDGDGRMEIIHSINPLGISRLVIYENSANNTFTQVYFNVESPQDAGPKVVADLDGDGRVEIAHCGHRGYLHIYESAADNVWQQTYLDTAELDNAYAVTGGVDTDGDGRPELFVSGDSQDIPGERLTFVYEATGDNSFSIVAILPYFDAHIGGVSSCVANLDGVSRQEFVLGVYPNVPELLIYRSVAPGQWVIAESFRDPDPNGGGGVNSFDVNRNGRAELLWVRVGNSNFGSTWVLEHVGVSPTDVRLGIEPRVEPLRIHPNPCTINSIVSIDPRHRTASTIATFDVSGRLVARSPARGSERILWSPLVRPGIYFVRLEDASGTSLAQGRVTVVH